MKNIINILKRKTKYGFTLIELISVIIIIGVIALISVPITINITNNAKNKAYKEIIDSIELSAYNYSVYNDLGYNRLYKALQVSTIKLAGYLDNEDIIDPRDNSTIDGCVMYRYMPSTENYEFRYTGSCTEKDFYPEIKIYVTNDNNKEWLNEKIRFTISGEYGQFKYCIGKNECNPDIYYNGETTFDTEGTNLIICATGYFGAEVGNSTCTKLYNIDYTNPTLTYTTPMKTNKITISASCGDSISGVSSTQYSLDGSSYTNKYVYTNIEYKEHNVSVKCTDVAGNVTVVDKKVTPPKITPPEITQISWYPNTTWAQWRIYKIKFNTGENDKNIENPYYYFKSSVAASITEGNIVEQCGTEYPPSSCSSKNATKIEPNTWYRTNNKEIKIKVEGSKDVRGVDAGTIYLVVYDGTNLSTTSTGMINYMDKEVPSIGEINITKMYTNKVILSASCQDQTGLSGVKEILYSIDGGNYQLSNIFSNVKEGTHTVKVKCIDNALNEIEKSSNVTPPKIVNPTITQVSQSPSGTWAQTRTYRITYNNTDVETPYYYFKSQVSGTVASGVVVQSCGTGNTPETCSSPNTTPIEPNTWYRTNNKEVLITYNTTLTTSNKYLYAVTYDGTNLSGSATQTIGLMDIIVPKIRIDLSGNIGSNNWYTSDVTGTIKLENQVPSGISVYYYGRTNTPSTQGSTFIHKEDGTNIEYCAKVISGSGVQSSVICKTFKRDTTPPAKPSLSLDRNYDSGISNTDNITNRYSNVRFTGNAEAYSTIDIRITSRNNNIIKQVATSSNGTYEFNIDLDQNKENIINICSVDAAGNYTCSDNLNVTVDTIAPTTPSITYNGGSNTHSWKNNYKIKLESSDSLSGIDRFLSDGNSDGSSEFDIGRTTSTTAIWTPWNGFSSCNQKYAVIDIAGNVSGWTGGQHIHMDTEKPSKTSVGLWLNTIGGTTYTNDTWTNQSVARRFYSEDSLSGINHYEWSYDCSNFGGVQPQDEAITWSGINEACYRAVDNAGNVGDWSNKVIIKIDKDKPTLTYNLSEGTYEIGQNITVTGNDTNFSNLWVHVYKDGSFVSSKSISGYTNNSYTVNMDSSGTWEIYAIVYDKAGNRQEAHVNNDGWDRRTYTIKPKCSYAINYVWNFDYKGSVETFTVPTGCNGVYKLEVWGAEGGGHPQDDSYGNKGNKGGLGGYSYGNISLSSGTNLYIAVGGLGHNQNTHHNGDGGYNGGGTGGSYQGSSIGSGGGGATHIATTNYGELFNYYTESNNNLNDILIVAGGGGGSDDIYNSPTIGGSGGGLTGGNGQHWLDSEGRVSPDHSQAGGTQSCSPYTLSNNKQGFGRGGNGQTDADAGGGGGGWCGGTAAWWSTVENHNAAGGGGSGHINTNYLTNSGMQNGVRSGNGYARITLISLN